MSNLQKEIDQLKFDLIGQAEDYEKLHHAYIKLQGDFEEYKNESIKWSVEDFTSLEVKGWTITDEQAKNALDAMIKGHDCTIGITWETVECYYQDYGTKLTPTIAEDVFETLNTILKP